MSTYCYICFLFLNSFFRSVKVFDSPYSYLLLYMSASSCRCAVCIDKRNVTHSAQTSDDGELHPSRSVVLLLCNHLDHFVFEKKGEEESRARVFHRLYTCDVKIVIGSYMPASPVVVVVWKESKCHPTSASRYISASLVSCGLAVKRKSCTYDERTNEEEECCWHVKKQKQKN